MSEIEYIDTGSGINYCANNILFETPEVHELQKKLRDYRYSKTAQERRDIQFWIECWVVKAMAQSTEKTAHNYAEVINNLKGMRK